MLLGDMRRKELALGRIKRLGTSGLALDPFTSKLTEMMPFGLGSVTRSSSPSTGSKGRF
jgi:hypothetical protein